MFNLIPLFSKLILLSLLLLLAAPFAAQVPNTPVSQETSEDDDKLPVLVKHLPDWESKRAEAKYFVDAAEFRSFFSARRITENLDFFPGTEAVFAKYPEGELLIVEYSTPQAAAAVNKAVIEKASSSGDYFIYRRIGNYSVFLFDPTDEPAGNKLLGNIKYTKIVTWPFGDPKPYFARERAFIEEASNLFVGTMLFILTGLGTALLIGGVAGYVYFLNADRRRVARGAYSDAGGLTRLNIDGLTSNVISDNLLDE